MILSGHEIRKQLGDNIHIDPFDDKRLNPNSYNLSLHDELLVYEENGFHLDCFSMSLACIGVDMSSGIIRKALVTIVG